MCVRACVHVCMRACASALRIASTDKILRFINTLFIIIDEVRDAGFGCSHVRIIVRLKKLQRDMQSCSSCQSTIAWTGNLPCRMTPQKKTFTKFVVVVVVGGGGGGGAAAAAAAVVEYSGSYCMIDVL